MDAQQTLTPQPPRPTFNAALFLGLCFVAVSIIISANIIGNRIPHTLHGNLHGNLHSTAIDNTNNDREFMSEWQAATFLGMHHEDFIQLIEAGELTGTYFSFPVYRYIWGMSREEFVTEFRDDYNMPRQIPEPERTLTYHRVFSRERLTEWMNNRINPT